ncbi:MAG TPA: hypothetical protein VH350_16820 [Candidatus Sulfotelmatobacter sp.]|nr:hypothetical protein [Candidatus Sulfotelmatobacter sp.]
MTYGADPGLAQFVMQAGLISAFQQAGAQLGVDFHRGGNDLMADFMRG